MSNEIGDIEKAANNGPVKCADCGLLAWRVIETRVIAEVEMEFRETANFSGATVRDKHEPMPLCSAHAANLREAIQIAGETPLPEHVLRVIQQNRECDAFIEWMPGLTPREHMEVVFRKEQRAFEKEMREEQRAFEKSLRDEQSSRNDAKDRQQAERDHCRDATQFKYNIIAQIVSPLVVTLIIFLTTWVLSMNWRAAERLPKNSEVDPQQKPVERGSQPSQTPTEIETGNTTQNTAA